MNETSEDPDDDGFYLPGDPLVRLLSAVRSVRPDVTHAMCGYSGEGDTGNTNWAAYAAVPENAYDPEEPPDADPWSPNEADVDEDAVRAAVRTEFPELVNGGINSLEDLLEQYVPSGYEIEDGGHGVVSVDLRTGRIEVRHYNVFREESAAFESYDIGRIPGKDTGPKEDW